MSILSTEKDRSRPIKEVIVYQMGKVGSTSLVASLNDAGIPAYQSHFLDTPSFYEVVDLFDHQVSVIEGVSHHLSGQLQENLLLRNKLTHYQNSEAPQTDTLGIITLVRDPLAWYFSNFSQNFFRVEKDLRQWLIHEQKLDEDESLTERHLQYFFAELFSCFCQVVPDMDQSHADLIQACFNEAAKTRDGEYYRFIYGQVSELCRVHFWFDKHFAALLDTDVLRYGFDNSRGFSLFHRKNVDIMLIKFEKLNELHDELAQFLGLPYFAMKRLNESKDKVLGQLISNTRKNLHIPDSFKQIYFSSEYYETFYNKESSMKPAMCFSHLQKRRQENPDINLKHSPLDDVSNCHKHKKAALESFLSFNKGAPPPEWPLELSIEVSNQCDMGCAMCQYYSPLNQQKYLHLPVGQRDFLDINNLQKIDDILQHAVVVHLGGYGEPTIHPRFQEIISYLSRFEVLVDFSTHGMKLNEAMCDHLVKHGVYRVDINLSGATKEDYESIYVGGDFERVLNNISLLSDAKSKYRSTYPIISVSSIAFDFQLEKFPLFVQTVAEHGAETVILKPLNTYDCIPQLHNRAIIMDPNKHAPLLEQALEIARQYKVNLITAPFTSTVNLPGNSAIQKAQSRHIGIDRLSTEHVSLKQIRSLCLDDITDKQVDVKPADFGTVVQIATGKDTPVYTINNKTPCFEPFKSLNIVQDGKVYPCPFGNRDMPMGNLTSVSSGQEILHNQLFSQFREHAIIQELPEAYCSNCIGSDSYPKKHNIGIRVQQYKNWFYHTFGAPFHIPVIKAIKKLQTNEQILKNHCQKKTVD